MKQTLKLALYYFLYQLGTLSVCSFFYSAAMMLADFRETGTWDFPENGYALPFLLTVTALIVSNLIVGWHLVHYRYVTADTIKKHRVPAKVYAAVVPLTLGMMLCTNYMNELLQLPDMNEALFMQMKDHLTGVLSIAVVAPIVEEALFRGAIAGHLFRIWRNPWGGILLSAFVFGIIHGNPAQIPFAMVLGIVLGWLYFRTGNLLPCILLHFINNALSVVLMTFMPEADTMSDLFGATGAPLWAAGGLAVTISCICALYKWTSSPHV